MNDRRWYVYQNATPFRPIQYFEKLEQAIEELKTVEGSHYSAIGVEQGMAACDLLMKNNGVYRISKDCTKTSFKTDMTITVDAVDVLQKSFKLEGGN